jgi:hypothetical protein
MGTGPVDAAYKAIEVCRRLVDAGAHVSPVLTPDSLHFVTTTTFSALASEPARTTLWDSPEPSPHTALGQAAEAAVVVEQGVAALQFLPADGYRDFVARGLERLRARIPRAASSFEDAEHA